MGAEKIGATIIRKGRCVEDGYGEPVARLDDGREMPMGWNRSGPTFEVGTKGTASYVTTATAGLWRFEPDEPHVTRAEIEAINAARRALEAIDARARELAWDAPSTVSAGAPRAQDFGRLSALADVAEEALFDVLNTCKVHELVELADADMYLHMTAEPDA